MLALTEEALEGYRNKYKIGTINLIPEIPSEVDNLPHCNTRVKVKARLTIKNKFPQTPSRIGRGQNI